MSKLNHNEVNKKLRSQLKPLSKKLEALGLQRDQYSPIDWAYKYYLAQTDHHFYVRFFIGKPYEHYKGVVINAQISYLGDTLYKFYRSDIELGEVNKIANKVYAQVKKIIDSIKDESSEIHRYANKRLENIKAALSMVIESQVNYTSIYGAASDIEAFAKDIMEYTKKRKEDPETAENEIRMLAGLIGDRLSTIVDKLGESHMSNQIFNATSILRSTIHPLGDGK